MKKRTALCICIILYSMSFDMLMCESVLYTYMLFIALVLHYVFVVPMFVHCCRMYVNAGR